jgi:DNA-directed RNA polymerase I subunit RPA12
MTAPCERCGYAMRLLAASPTIACSSCNKSHSTEKVFNDDAKTTKTSSNAASFLYKFNIEPRNPDGTKIGSERHDDDVERERATVDEPCPKCPNQVLRFYTMQLRSADEGQTVFYECEKCKHTFSQNN